MVLKLFSKYILQGHQQKAIIEMFPESRKRIFFTKGGEKMRITVLLLTVLIAVAFVGSAFAVPPGKTVEYAGGGMGKVVFDGKTHADKGLKCNDCHTKIFKMKKGDENYHG